MAGPQGMKLGCRFYASEAGNEPVRDWLRDAAVDIRRAVGEDIKTVQIGWPIGMPVVRKLDTDLWEVRTIFDHGIARVIFTLDGLCMVLLHGFIKKSEKTPQVDIATANKRKSLLNRKSK